MKNNKKYHIDISLEINASDLSQTEEDILVITKEINGQIIALNLPVVERGTAQGFIDDEIYEHYWNAVHGTQGFWLREKEKNMKFGLELLNELEDEGMDTSYAQ